MNAGYVPFIAGSESERRDVFLTAANRLGTTIQNVEKDFWVCWTLDALFNGLPEGGPRLLFKGGTSLSKAFGLISRFSEDIDITVFRQDIGDCASIEELETLGGKKRRERWMRLRVLVKSDGGRPNTRVTSRKVAVSLPPPPPFQSPIGCSYPEGKARTDSRAPKLTA